MGETVQCFGNPKRKKRLFYQQQWRNLLVAFLVFTNLSLFGEGSVNFINYDGLRLFYSANEQQQLKVYASAGEYINVGASHVGLTDGYINVYRPDGTLHTTFDNTGATAGLAIIYNDVEEKNGPTGGGMTMGGGYIPGVISVGTGEEGVWTVTLEFPIPTILVFSNLHNSEMWTREFDQPLIQRSVLAWDITVSQGQSGNQGGTLLSGRVFSNEYISVVSRNGNKTSPEYNVLTKDGFMYKVKFKDTDPWNFPLFSNSSGLSKGNGEPAYRSLRVQDVTRIADTSNWVSSDFYLYEPQAEDVGAYINNKIFFNAPNPDLPSNAVTTDIFRNNTHETWLYDPPIDVMLSIQSFIFTGENSETELPCPPEIEEQNAVAYITFSSNISGAAVLRLDLNSDGDYDDEIDRDIYKFAQAEGDTIHWDGLDGLGNEFIFTNGFGLNYQLVIRGGEIHILMSDVENDLGGVSFELLNPPTNVTDINSFYYDHTAFGQATDVSGGGTSGNPLPTMLPFTYSNNYGNEKMLDYWTFVDYGQQGFSTFDIEAITECAPTDIDSDGDGIIDKEDLDDDNDGVPDKLEFCFNLGDFDCLPNDLDPSGDEDADGIPNYQDADGLTLILACSDINADGICDNLLLQYDLDGDNIPNHLDLDSDHDGITDLVEAGHAQVDADGNGIIDGVPADFGLNGFYNAIASDTDAFTAIATYTPWDKDNDSRPDYHDLDSDNDGINDVEEAGFGANDADDNGRLPLPTNLESGGLSAIVDPNITGLPIPLPLDTDNDLVPDRHDLDSDNDGINDVEEAGQPDEDNDGVIGIGTPQVNIDGHATADALGIPLFITSQPTSTDGDDIPDYRDLDSDNDGLNDVAEAGFEDENNDGLVGNNPVTVNVDGQPTIDNMTSISDPKDSDTDGLADYRDLDSDNDGINDVEETGNGETDGDNNGIIGIGQATVNEHGQSISDMSGMVLSTTSQARDTDNDNVPDYNDLDTDNDGIYDVEEASFSDADPDEDGILGTGIPTINSVGQATVTIDGILIRSTSKPNHTDFDAIPDYQDLDTDNDGINDVAEANGMDADDDGVMGTGTPVVDANGVVTGVTTNTTSTPEDTDNDGIADYRDLDSDNDAINDVLEAGLTDFDNDGIVGIGAPMVNTFGQAIADAANAPISTISNVPDTDGDTVPDYRDLDSDNDAINDVVEGGSFDEDNDGIAGTGMPFVNDNGQPLISGDGELISTTSNPTDTDDDDIPDFLDLDSDADGISDVVEGGHTDPDNNDMVGIGIPMVNENGQALGDDAPTSNPTETDGDGDFDFQELDSDNDGILDEFECPDDAPCIDGDSDGIFDFQDTDRDNDGIDDAYECETGAPCVDTDEDGIPDVDDLDSDNDTLSDTDECPNGNPCPDSDDDGIDDFRELDCVEMGLPVISDLTGEGVHCAGEDLVLSAMNTTELEGEVTFVWTGPNDFEFVGTAPASGPFMVIISNVQESQEGAYTLTLLSEIGCESSPQSIVVGVDAQPSTPMISLSVETNFFCAGEIIELNTTSYTGEVIYNWYFTPVNDDNAILIEMTESPTLILSNVDVLNSGVYSVTATVDACNSNPSNEISVIVEGTGEPINTDNSTSPDTPACMGETISFSATPLIEGTTYEWVGPNGFSSTDPTPSLSDIAPENAGEYFVFVSHNGCPAVASFSTMVYVQETVQATIGGGGILCLGESTSFEVTNDLSIEAGSTVEYHWFEAATNTIVATTTEPNLTLNNISSAEAGDYYLNVIVNGCTSESSNLASVQLVEQPTDQAAIVADVMEMCKDEEITIEAVTGNSSTGKWTTTSSSTIVAPDEPETIVFGLEEGENLFIWTLYTAECGDYSSDTLRIMIEEDIIEATADEVEIPYDETLNNYDLLDNDNLIGVPDGYTFSIVEMPTRGELIFDENGIITYTPDELFLLNTAEFIYEICSISCPDVCDETTVTISVSPPEFSSQCFIPNTFSPNEDGMNDAFSIECLETSHPNNKIMVFNRWGDKVFEKESYHNDWKGTYKNQDLPPGTYFYILKLDKNLDASLQGYMSLVR